MLLKKKTEPVQDRWTHLTLGHGQTLTAELLMAAFHGDVSALRLPALYGEADMAQVAGKVASSGGADRYVGLDLGSPLGVPTHWELRYTRNAAGWAEHFAKLRTADLARRRLFAKTGDPAAALVGMLQRVWPGKVSRMRHPRYGRELFFGLLRSGVPELHYDWAPFDLEEPNVVAQLGWNLYVFNPGPGGDLKMYRTMGMTPGNREDSGLEPVGNYGLSPELVEGVESDVVLCRTGDVVLAPNRFLHEVTPCLYGDQRLTLTAHVALMRDGSLRLFN